MLAEALGPGGAFAEMAKYNQFILWKAVPGFKKDGSVKKLPINSAGNVSSAHDTNAWLNSQDALAYAGALGCGVGFVFTDKDPFFFIDTDKAWDGSKWNAQTNDLYSRFIGAGVENSQSQTGMHIFGMYRGDIKHSCKNIPLDMELYTSGRFVALTGLGAHGSVGTDHTASLQAAVDIYFPPKITEFMDWTEEAVKGWCGITDDGILIEKARKSKSQFGDLSGRASFDDLWTGNLDAYSGDASSADMALAQHLAFWTGNNCERIESIMMQSELVRDKWIDRDDYLRRTIMSAAALQKEFHMMSVEPDAPTIPEAKETGGKLSASMADGLQLLSPVGQMELFEGCVYLRDLDKILVPDGAMLNQSQFKNSFGGYDFIMDGSGKVSKDAWEVFTRSRTVRFPKANMTCFKPELEYGSVVVRDNRRLVNGYVDLKVPNKAGDPSPFLGHLAKILPVKRDQEILLSWMAACVKYRGVKFLWAPLIQGTHGNGKTLISTVLAEALGWPYVHKPRADELGEKFNDWMLNKLLISVDDIKISGKSNVLEVLKTWITESKVEIRAMNTSKRIEDICCNYIFNSNFKDAIEKARGERRFAIFYCAQQTKTDLSRDGLDGRYFPKLYAWLRNGGYAIVTNFLNNYNIPNEFNPAVTVCEEAEAQNAPATSSEDEVNREVRGVVEQLICDALEDGLIGFKGGLASSTHIKELLAAERKTIKSVKYRELMDSLGYISHPALNKGRSTRPISCDSMLRSVIYVAKDRLDLQSLGASDLIDTYIKLQEI